MAPEPRRPNRPAIIFFAILAIGAAIWILYFIGFNIQHEQDMKTEKAHGDPSVTPARGAP